MTPGADRRARAAARAAAPPSPERSALLCDVDGTLAPIVAEPEDAAVPERDARAARRARAPLRARRLHVRAAGRRGAARSSASTRSPTSATTGSSCSRPGAAEAVLDPALATRSPSACGAFARGAFDGRAASAGRAARGQGRDLGASTGAAPPDEDAARRRARAGRRGAASAQGLRPALGAHGARDPARRSPPTRAPRSTRCSPSAPVAPRALRRRRHDRPRRLPHAARARAEGRLERAVCVGVRSAEGPGGDRRARPTSSSTGPRASSSCSQLAACTSYRVRYTDFLKATVLLAAGEATALAVVTIAVAAGEDDTTHARSSRSPGGSWPALIGIWLGRRARDHHAASARCSRRRSSTTTLPRDPARRRAAQPALAAGAVGACSRRASSWLFPQFAAVVGRRRDPDRARVAKAGARRDRDRGTRRRPLLRRAELAVPGDRARAHAGAAGACGSVNGAGPAVAALAAALALAQLLQLRPRARVRDVLGFVSQARRAVATP